MKWEDALEKANDYADTVIPNVWDSLDAAKHTQAVKSFLTRNYIIVARRTCNPMNGFCDWCGTTILKGECSTCRRVVEGL